MLVILTLISVVNCKIYVHILPETKDKNASVTAYGTETALMTDLEQRSFSLIPKQISCRLSRSGIAPPNYVYVRGTSYYGCRDIYTTLRPSAAKITGMKRNTIVVFYKELVNNSSVPATFKMGIKEEVLERMSLRWSANSDLSIGKELEIDFAQRLHHTSTWDKEDNEVKVHTISSSSDVELTLQPGQNATITMEAVRVRLDVSVEYAATLQGDIYCQYTVFLIPIGSKVLDVNEYFKMAYSSGVISGTEYIYVNYYAGGHVIVQDGGGALIMTPIQID